MDHKPCGSWSIFYGGRRGGIRTRDPLHPMQVRYQAALHAEALNYSVGIMAYLGAIERGGQKIPNLRQFASHLENADRPSFV